MDYLTFNGVSTADYGVYISGAESFNAPERDITFFSVPGRNGDLAIDNNRFRNIAVTYPAFIRDDFPDKRNALISALLGQNAGYKKLITTYDTDHFRLGVFSRGMEFVTGPGNTSGKFGLVFECKPQRFLASGENNVTLTASGTVNNPTAFEAMPLIRVYGTGTVTVNGTAVTIKTAGSYTDIDSELQDCYRGTVNCNNYVTLTDFPTLVSGSNAVVLGAGITSIRITPRWWEL